MSNAVIDSTSLAKWLSYLASCHPKTIDLGLERIRRVAARLGVLNLGCPVITVAGTNGKGSTVALTAAILRSAGLRVATYTSPHLISYNERFQIDGHCVDDQALCQAFRQIEKLRNEISLSYFEFGTLAALLLFKQAPLDVVILEVGLGGRLDAVNCIDADLAIISMIDLDHMEYLGNTREAIAYEKAGILRAQSPCVCGDFSIPTTLIDVAQSLTCPLYRQAREFTYQLSTSMDSWSWHSQQQSLTHLPIPNIELQNAATVLQAIELLETQFSISRIAIEQGLKQVFLPGRFQVIDKDARQIILDVAHNPAGGRCLAKRLTAYPCSGKTYALVGMLANKDQLHTLQALQATIEHWIVTDLLVAQSATAQQLKQVLQSLGITHPISEFSTPELAFQYTYPMLKPGDRLVVFGSFHTVAPILARTDNF